MTATARPTLVRAALLTIVVTMAGSLLGLVRDLLLARFFGADGGTDAFLVAWTVPETAFVLVVEGAMSLLMIPVFSRALAQHRAAREVVAATLPRVLVVLVTLSAATAAGAPVVVRLVAPGLADPALAVTCTRLTAITVLTFGIAGYLSAALRASGVFGAPAAIHLAYNVGIVGLMATLHGRLGIVSAAAGVALGSLFMVLVQVPGFLRHVGLPRRWRGSAPAVTLGLVAPIVVYTLARQAQVFVERHLGSSLAPGTISYLNYAQKVAQIPMLIALLVCTVTFPTLARNVAAGETEQARRRVETDLRTVTALILVAAAYLVAYAPRIVAVLLEHGRFTAADTAATAAIMRVYALGVLGHAMVGVLSRPFFTGERRTWYPAVAMAAGLAVTTGLAVVAVPWLGAYAIAAANGIGITTTAVLLLLGLRRHIVAVSVPAVGAATARLAAAAAGAGTAGWLAARATASWSALPAAVVGGLLVLSVFVLLARSAGIAELRRFPHVR
ncbi:lipid II flippase MurJ [Nucisporomicrobium flavum]|jgi:putative peptidoglycan lipid II flippase|uniref:lipid II flippase MurJ n=1 Tax=Nucisporomicrobium flavum TaxID=2785915 RepID=UPI0018F5908B|nr:lipid II flippase MurJ [Nucisporomicrobium flavum]